MAQQYSLDRILELERLVLRTVCGPRELSDPEARDGAIHDLAGYTWRAAEHRIVYAALVRVRQTSSASSAELLPAQATRMGFPDVDWGRYLRPTEGAELDIRALILELKAAKDVALL